jgi:hypothetical protein
MVYGSNANVPRFSCTWFVRALWEALEFIRLWICRSVRAFGSAYYSGYKLELTIELSLQYSFRGIVFIPASVLHALLLELDKSRYR